MQSAGLQIIAVTTSNRGMRGVREVAPYKMCVAMTMRVMDTHPFVGADIIRPP